MISLLPSVIWSSSVYVVWVVWVFGFLGWYLGCRSCSQFVSLLLYLLLPSLSFVLKLLSVLWRPVWLFFWALSLWNASFFPLMFFCQTASIFALFSVVCLTHSSSSFFITTSKTDSFSIKAVNFWSISSSFFLKYYLLVVSISISVFSFVRSSLK